MNAAVGADNSIVRCDFRMLSEASDYIYLVTEYRGFYYGFVAVISALRHTFFTAFYRGMRSQSRP